MTKLIEMPEVMKCEALECAYNKNAQCCARGITVGDIQDHLCDTMWKANQHTHRKENAGVGACRTTDCTHNADFECQADGINVSLAGGIAKCETFSVG